jgi:hypothetical protein
MGNTRPFSYPSDVGNEEWRIVAPYLVLRREDAPQRILTAGGISWASLSHEDRQPVADDAEGSAVVAGRLSANAAVDTGRVL